MKQIRLFRYQIMVFEVIHHLLVVDRVPLRLVLPVFLALGLTNLRESVKLAGTISYFPGLGLQGAQSLKFDAIGDWLPLEVVHGVHVGDLYPPVSAFESLSN